MITVRMGDRRYLFQPAIGGEYYNRIAELIADEVNGLHPPPKGRVILCESERSWVVTLPGDKKGDKLPWVRCASLAHAQRVKEFADAQ